MIKLYDLDNNVLNYSHKKDILLWVVAFISSLLIGIAGIFYLDEILFLLGKAAFDSTIINVVKFVCVFICALLCIYAAIKFLKVNSNLDALISSDKADNINTLLKEDARFLDQIQSLLSKVERLEVITNRDYYYYNIDIIFEDYIQKIMQDEIKCLLSLKQNESDAIYSMYNSRLKNGYEDLQENFDAPKEVLKTAYEIRPNFDNKGIKYIFNSIIRAIGVSLGYFVYLISLVVIAVITNGVGPYYRPTVFLRGGVDRVSLFDHSRFLKVAKYDPVIYNYLQQVQHQGRTLVDTDLSVVNLNKREALLKTVILYVELNGSKAVAI